MNYATIKLNFQKGLWSKMMVRKAVEKGVLSEAEYAEIVDGEQSAAGGAATK